jgi:hypothetical protein
MKFKEINFNTEDLETINGLHTIFVTASPVLTNEVKRYFGKLTSHVKEELVKKNKIAQLVEDGRGDQKNEEDDEDEDPALKELEKLIPKLTKEDS